MKIVKLIKPMCIIVGLLLVAPVTRAADEAISLDELLSRVKEGRVDDARENKERIQRFESNKAQQTSLLNQARQEKAAQEQRSKQLEENFDNNETLLIELREQLKLRLGDLKELFGVMQQVAGDARSDFELSLTNIEYPDRSRYLTALVEKMGSDTQLASMNDIERLWYELQREMTESGKVKQINTTVVTAGGEPREQAVTRVGVFNIVSNGKYLEYNSDTQRVVEIPRQPNERFLQMAGNLENQSSSDFTPFAVDPSRGQILSLLVQTPNLRERIDQGGLIGYIIIALGALVLLVVVIKLLLLTMTGIAVRLQIRNPAKPKKGNPLGRILKVYHDNTDTDLESLELKLGEAILKETPRIERWNVLIKIIAVVAPLLGLLGTVTGMIITFQAITLFGTGDPKLMAGGISQALVTTVLGLTVAIPTVLLHVFVKSRSTRLVEIIEQQAAGLIASYAEQQGKGGS